MTPTPRRSPLAILAKPALLSFAGAASVAAVLAVVVLSAPGDPEPARPTPDGTAIPAPDDEDLALLQTPTPPPTADPTLPVATEAPPTVAATEPPPTAPPTPAGPTPTPRVIDAEAPRSRPAGTPAAAAPKAAAFAPAAEPTPLPNVRVTPTPAAPPPDLPPAEVLAPVDVGSAAPTSAAAPTATDSPTDVTPSPTAIRIVPGGPPEVAAASSGEPGVVALAPSDPAATIRATVEAIQEAAFAETLGGSVAAAQAPLDPPTAPVPGIVPVGGAAPAWPGPAGGDDGSGSRPAVPSIRPVAPADLPRIVIRPPRPGNPDAGPAVRPDPRDDRPSVSNPSKSRGGNNDTKKGGDGRPGNNGKNKKDDRR